MSVPVNFNGSVLRKPRVDPYIAVDGEIMDTPIFRADLPRHVRNMGRFESGNSNRMTATVEGPSGDTITKHWSVARNTKFDLWRTPEYDWYLTVADLNGVDHMMGLLEV